MVSAARTLSNTEYDVTPSSSSASDQKTPDARDRILTAAIMLFSMRGFEGVSTTQIAKLAGITQPLIHYHFKNKEALWKAAGGRLFSQLQDEFVQPLDAESVTDKKRFLIESVRSFVAFSARHPEFSRFLSREGAQQSERLEWLAEQLVKPVIQPFYESYLEGVTEGWLKPMPFPQLLMLVLSSASSFFSLSPLVNQLFDVDALAEPESLTQSDMVVEIILNSVFVGQEEPATSASSSASYTAH